MYYVTSLGNHLHVCAITELIGQQFPRHQLTSQARNHRSGWSGFNLTTFTQFMQLRFYSFVALQTSFVKMLLYSNIFR